MNTILIYRLNKIPQLYGLYDFLTKDCVTTELQIIRSEIMGSKSKYQRKSISISENNPDDVREYLLGLPIGKDIKINLFWVSINAGISLSFYNFVINYDELWYPSSDDVWLTDKDHSFLLCIDHEENISYYSQ
jgi:hypothetical protein